MTPDVDDPQLSPPTEAPSRSGRRRDALAVREVCPLLVSVDGGWRSAYGSRDHRCWAVRPPAPLALGKQRQLCLVLAHDSCATFVAADAVTGARDPDPGTDPGQLAPAAGLWPAVRSTPLVLEPSRGRTGPLPVSASRTGGQTLLVALMVLAFLILIIARAGTPSSPGPSPASPGTSIPLGTLPAQAASGGPGPSVPVLPSASVAASPGPSAVPSATASAGAPSPSPLVVRRYKVRSGDTLYGIATRFGTTVNAIEAANGITAQSVIRVGQVLVIP